MRNYTIYTSEYGDEVIVEIYNKGDYELLNVQKDLISQGYIIEEVCGKYIKCYLAQKIESDSFIE